MGESLNPKQIWEAKFEALKSEDNLPLKDTHIFIEIYLQDKSKDVTERFQECTEALGAIIEQKISKKCHYMVCKSNITIQMRIRRTQTKPENQKSLLSISYGLKKCVRPLKKSITRNFSLKKKRKKIIWINLC